MGKDALEQNERPNLAAVPNKDLMQRMNFLYQVASHLSQQGESPLKQVAVHKDQESRGAGSTSKKTRKRSGSLKDLAGFHIRTMKAIGSKSMIKMDPSVKRTLCQVCWSVMVPGQSSTTRIDVDPVFRFRTRSICSNCGWKRLVPTPPQLREGDLNDGSTVSPSGARNSVVSKRWSRASRPAPLFQRDGHVVHIPGQAQENQQASEKG